MSTEGGSEDRQLKWPSNSLPSLEAREDFSIYLRSIGYLPEQTEHGPRSDRYRRSPGFMVPGGRWIMPNGYTDKGEPVILKSRHNASGKAARRKAAGFAQRAGTRHAEIWTWDQVDLGFVFVKIHVVDAAGKVL